MGFKVEEVKNMLPVFARKPSFGYNAVKAE